MFSAEGTLVSACEADYPTEGHLVIEKSKVSVGFVDGPEQDYINKFASTRTALNARRNISITQPETVTTYSDTTADRLIQCDTKKNTTAFT